MDLKSIIKPENCILLTNRTKTEAILELLDVVKENFSEPDFENLKKEVFFREQLMSTGIGNGIAIPHVRYEGVKDPIIIVGVQPEKIEDYDSMDGVPVSLVFLFIVGKDQHKNYLRLLALVSRKLKENDFRQNLLKSKNSEEIAHVLTVETI